MRKVLGLTLAMVLTLTLSAMAGEADRSIALEDGMTLSVSDSQITGLTAGDQVPAMLEMEAGKDIVSGIETSTVGSDAMYATPIDSQQAE